MTTPSPFDVAKSVGTSLTKGFQAAEDKSVLDPIIKEAIASNDQTVLNNALGQILQNVQDPTLRKEVTGAFQTRIKQVVDQQKVQQTQEGQRLTPEQRQKFRDAKFKEEEIDLFEQSPVGGKTEIIKNALDRIQRETPSQIIDKPKNIQEILKNQDANLTPKERAKAKLKRGDVNSKEITSRRKGLSNAKIERGQLNVLNQLNDTGKLPTNIQKINLKENGSLRFPGLAGPEAELFQKTINDFLRNIKSEFGARITDFDIKAFMRKLPSLWNSEEGRRAIIRQLSIVNEIKQLEDKGVIDAFADHGGAGNVALDSAETIANINNGQKIEELIQEYQNIDGALGGLGGDSADFGEKILTAEDVRKFRKKALGNEARTKKLAKEAGFKVS